MRDIQRQTLASAGKPISWLENFEAAPSGPAFIVANEFFDALPVRHYVKTLAGWRQRLVGLDQQDDIPLIGVVDSNHSPEGIDYIIPGNDDSSKAVTLYARGIADAILEGRANAVHEVVKSAQEANEDEFVEVEDGAQA